MEENVPSKNRLINTRKTYSRFLNEDVLLAMEKYNFKKALSNDCFNAKVIMVYPNLIAFLSRIITEWLN